MSPSNQDIDDLLSGMLDGVLTVEELTFLERELAKDPTLQARFDELTFLRRSLLSGRNVATLGPNFAAAVTQAARVRARENGQVTPESKVLQEPESALKQGTLQVPQSRNHHGWLRWVYVGAVSIATCVVVLVFTFSRPDNGSMLSISKLESNEPSSSEKNNKDLSLADAPLLHEIAKDIVEEMDNRPIAAESIADAVPRNGNRDEIAEHRIADSKTVSPKLEADLIPKEKAIDSTFGYFLYVLDVTVTQSAVESRALERILEKHQIIYTDDLAISDEQLAMLENSKLAGGNSVATSEKMGVVFLRSTARRLGSAINEIILQFQDFPEFAQNISTDRSATELVKQLSQIKVAESSGGVAQRFSLPKAPGASYPFASSARVGKPMPKEKRLENGKKQPLLSGDGMANALILLRPAKQ